MDEKRNVELQQLINEGFSEYDAKMALAMSHDDKYCMMLPLSAIDFNTILQSLGSITENARINSLRLILKIFDNILLNPKNDKYKRLNINTLSKKLLNHKKVWFQLLSQVGFNETNDNTHLLFDMHQFSSLRYAKNILLTYKWMGQSPHNKQILRNDICALMKAQNTNIYCMCGFQLKQINGGFGICKVCSNSNSDIYWHCIQNNEHHPLGFELCNHCAIEISHGNKQVIRDKNDRMSIWMNGLIYINQIQRDMDTSTVCLPNYESFLNVDCDILSCPQLQMLQRIFRLFLIPDCWDKLMEHIIDIIDAFLHLMHVHDTDKDFKHIITVFGKCDIVTCKSFQRINRDKSKDNIKEKSHRYVFVEIMDKIHCYLLHSYDIGSKIAMVHSISDTDEKQLTTPESCTQLINGLKVVLLDKRRKYQNIDGYIRMNNRLTKKYNQMGLNDKPNNKQGIYSFGFYFKYGYRNEDPFHKANKYITVIQKHKSLKEEITSNNIFRISMEQFQNEYRKA
eukprot:19640_1